MNRAPSEYELGAAGDRKDYKLELRLIAHFGLVIPLVLLAAIVVLAFFSLSARLSQCWKEQFITFDLSRSTISGRL